MKKKAVLAYVFAAMVFVPVAAKAAVNSHENRVTAYEGTKSCTGCHSAAAKDVAESLHYQQQAVPKYLADWPRGESAGMMKSF